MFQIIKIQAVLKQEIMVVFKFHSYLYYKELKLLKTFFTRIGLVTKLPGYGYMYRYRGRYGYADTALSQKTPIRGYVSIFLIKLNKDNAYQS